MKRDVSSGWPTDTVLATARAHEQSMANRAITDHRFAFDDLCDHVDFVVGEQHANALSDGRGIATDGDELTVGADAHRDVAREP
jgi:hypothetical protein